MCILFLVYFHLIMHEKASFAILGPKCFTVHTSKKLSCTVLKTYKHIVCNSKMFPPITALISDCGFQAHFLEFDLEVESYRLR